MPLALPYYTHFAVKEKLIAAEQEMELMPRGGQSLAMYDSRTMWQLKSVSLW